MSKWKKSAVMPSTEVPAAAPRTLPDGAVRADKPDLLQKDGVGLEQHLRAFT
jgi:hypothetical protein